MKDNPLLIGILVPLLMGLVLLCVCGGVLIWLPQLSTTSTPVPEYIVLDRINARGSSKTVEIAISTFSNRTSHAEIQTAAAAIAEAEQAERLVIFSSRSAWKAQYSESYMREHPESRDGYLGIYERGRFKPPH